MVGMCESTNLKVNCVAGGSGLNTATHLNSLLRHSSCTDSIQDLQSINVSLHSALNESDDYGQLLLNHAYEQGFQFINCRNKCRQVTDNDDDIASVTGCNYNPGSSKSVGRNSHSKAINSAPVLSTGHCIVVVSQGDRSFMTHLGVMGNFSASDIRTDELINMYDKKEQEEEPSSSHHRHIHVAGYYNIPGFFNGKLKEKLEFIRAKRSELNEYSSGNFMATTTMSLVPQHDATNEWDGGLLDILQCIDFLILSSVEAKHITQTNRVSLDGEEENSDLFWTSDNLTAMAQFFVNKSPHTYIIVTLGPRGAVALYAGKILTFQHAPKLDSAIVDPTGAGDAFAAGFLYGLMKWRRQQENNDFNAKSASYSRNSWNEAVVDGLRWGCVAGTSCVMQRGASVPSAANVIQTMMKTI